MVSYGGSALIATLAAIGILLNVTRLLRDEAAPAPAAEAARRRVAELTRHRPQPLKPGRTRRLVGRGQR
jgi:hypothetical protein